MAEHPPLLDTAQILSSDISLLSAPIVSADGTQQVILVQVNPGEAFTIRREDGQFQCITGPAQVPMMSPNGSVPPIYVPPGYAPQMPTLHMAGPTLEMKDLLKHMNVCRKS